MSCVQVQRSRPAINVMLKAVYLVTPVIVWQLNSSLFTRTQLSFDRAHVNTLDKILLQERIDAQDRKGADDGNGHFQ